MRKANKVDIWMNGKKINENQSHKAPADERTCRDSRLEHAAAADNSDITKTAHENKQYMHKNSSFIRKSKMKNVKPFFLAAFSAIIIGSLLGFFLLNMFVDINADMDGHEGSPASLAENDAGVTDSDGEGKAGSPLQPDSPFVLQAGKYSEKSNAKRKAEAYRAEDYPGIVWKKDGFFFVLSGAAESSQTIEKMADKFARDDLEVYVKEWETSSVQKDLPAEDKDWLKTFTEKWQTSLKKVNAGDPLSEKAWSNVTDDIPEDASQATEDLAAFITNQKSQMGKGKWHDQQILLNLWEKEYKLLH